MIFFPHYVGTLLTEANLLKGLSTGVKPKFQKKFLCVLRASPLYKRYRSNFDGYTINWMAVSCGK